MNYKNNLFTPKELEESEEGQWSSLLAEAVEATREAMFYSSRNYDVRTFPIDSKFSPVLDELKGLLDKKGWLVSARELDEGFVYRIEISIKPKPYERPFDFGCTVEDFYPGKFR